MKTAANLAQATVSTFVDVVYVGEGRPVIALDIADSDETTSPGAGELVLAVGFAEIDDLIRVLQSATGLAGVVVRRAWAEVAALREVCMATGVTLIALAPGVTWSIVVEQFRALLDAQAGAPDTELGDHAYGDLFDLADRVGGILAAPVTIEDSSSKVVAYSTGQDDVDAARTSSIFGRRVPRQIRDHFRSLGVFRRLAHTTEPFFVAGNAAEVRGRFIVPIHAGGEWLGSVWAVVDDAPDESRTGELEAAAELIALHLLRLRSRGELVHQLQLDQIRSALQGGPGGSHAAHGRDLSRVVVLKGPEPDLDASSRRELWTALARRRGWRQPVIADLDGRVYAIVEAEGGAPASWAWLARLVEAEEDRRPGLAARAGSAVTGRDGLARSRREADELDGLGLADLLATVDDHWSGVILDRALGGLRADVSVSPLASALARSADPTVFAATLEAVIDHWGEPRRAARVLGVHPNTVRNRLVRMLPDLGADLEDPLQRTALRLELMLRVTDPSDRPVQSR